MRNGNVDSLLRAGETTLTSRVYRIGRLEVRQLTFANDGFTV